MGSPTAKDFELKRVLLGKENVSSNQKAANNLKKNNDVIAYDIDFATSDESVAAKKRMTEYDPKAKIDKKAKGITMFMKQTQ